MDGVAANSNWADSAVTAKEAAAQRLMREVREWFTEVSLTSHGTANGLFA